VIDIWDGLETFEQFRDARIVPHVQAVGLGLPQVRMIEAEDEMPDDGRRPAFVQWVVMPGVDREVFRRIHEQVVPGGVRPDGLTFHINGPFNGGWSVIDGWTSRAIRDSFMERTRPILETAPMSGPPTIDELQVEATMSGRAPART
jgi:hypothetical protein